MAPSRVESSEAVNTRLKRAGPADVQLAYVHGLISTTDFMDSFEVQVMSRCKRATVSE